MRQEPRLEPDLGATLRTPPRPAPLPAAPRPRRESHWERWVLLALVLLIATPPGVVLLLRWVPPPTTAYMLQSPVKPVQYQWVPAARIADVARRAVIIAEDQKFRQHHGFDLEAMAEAYEHNQKSRHRRGASTISQQTAKNLFLWPGGGYWRKGVEAGITVLLEALWGKDRILEVYLNVVELGPGIYGVEAASQAYFGKHAADLDANQAARLAAVLPNPRRWSVRTPGPYVQSRVGSILAQMSGRASVMPEQELPPGFDETSDELPADEPVAPAAAEAAPASESPPEITPTPAPPVEESLPEPVPITPETPPPQ